MGILLCPRKRFELFSACPPDDPRIPHPIANLRRGSPKGPDSVKRSRMRQGRKTYIRNRGAEFPLKSVIRWQSLLDRPRPSHWGDHLCHRNAVNVIGTNAAIRVHEVKTGMPQVQNTQNEFIDIDAKIVRTPSSRTGSPEQVIHKANRGLDISSSTHARR